MKNMEKEKVNHPQHYKGDGGLECIDAMIGAYGLDSTILWCRLTAFKYLYRGGKKDETIVDLEKAKWYIDKEIELRKLLNN